MSDRLTNLHVRLQQRLGDVEVAAREWGVRPDHLEGRFISAMAAAQQGSADVALAAAETFETAAAEMNTWVQEARDTADAHTRRAETQLKSVEGKTEQALAAVVEKLIPAATAALGDAVVIRERSRGRRYDLGLISMGAAAAVVLLTTGYWIKAAADRPALELHAACLRQAVKSEGSGRLYCPVDALSSQVTTQQRR